MALSEQEIWNQQFEDSTPKLISKKAMEKMIQNARQASLLRGSCTNFDPIESAMASNPKLTRESAEKMAEEFGFL